MITVECEIGVLPHQREFAEDRGKHIAMVGGFGSGKSLGAVYRTADLLKYRNNRKEKGRILMVSPTYRLLTDVNLPRYEQFFDQYNIKYSLKKSEHKIIVHSGVFKGEIWLRSASNHDKIVGFDCSDAILDEFDTLKLEDQKSVWNKVQGRARGAKDTTIAICTTPEGYKYTYQKFVEEKAGKLIRVNTADNIFLPEDYIDNMYAEYDAQLVKQYIDGEFVNLTNLNAYYAFTRKILIDEYKPVTNDILVGMDFNVDPMTAVISEQVDGHLYTYGEIYLRDSNTYRMVEVIKDRYPDKNVMVYPDMTGQSRKTSAAWTDIQILKKAGFIIRGISNPRVRNRINTVNNALSKGKISIVKTLNNLITDLEQVGVDKYGELDKSDPKLTHISDAFGYMIYRLFPMKMNTSFKRRNL